MSGRKRHPVKSAKRLSPHLPERCLSEMRRLAPLIVNERWAEAVGPLEELNARYPGHTELLVPLVQAYQHLQDFGKCAHAASCLLKLTPEDEALTFMLANLYAGTDRPALALQTFHRYIEKFPRAGNIEEAQAAVQELTSLIVEIVGRPDLPEADAIDLATLEEESLAFMAQGEYARCRQTARKNSRAVPLVRAGEKQYRHCVLRGRQTRACCRERAGRSGARS